MRLFSNSEKEAPEETNNITPINEIEQEETKEETNIFSSNASSSSPFQSVTRLVEEDSLLKQIDEFRKKAEALQSLINERQDKVLSLEETVKEKENKNEALQSELSQKQEALNSVLEDIKGQFNIFADRVDTSVSNAVNEAKEPVIEKIHTENVRLYRNLYDFIKEDYDTDEFEDYIKETVKAGRGPVKVALFFSIFNTVLLIAVLLLQFGIF